MREETKKLILMMVVCAILGVMILQVMSCSRTTTHRNITGDTTIVTIDGRTYHSGWHLSPTFETLVEAASEAIRPAENFHEGDFEKMEAAYWRMLEAGVSAEGIRLKMVEVYSRECFDGWFRWSLDNDRNRNRNRDESIIDRLEIDW